MDIPKYEVLGFDWFPLFVTVPFLIILLYVVSTLNKVKIDKSPKKKQ